MRWLVDLIHDCVRVVILGLILGAVILAVQGIGEYLFDWRNWL
jgi:hypothetical protein